VREREGVFEVFGVRPPRTSPAEK
jgi:hypothetical protein